MSTIFFNPRAAAAAKTSNGDVTVAASPPNGHPKSPTPNKQSPPGS